MAGTRIHWIAAALGLLVACWPWDTVNAGATSSPVAVVTNGRGAAAGDANAARLRAKASMATVRIFVKLGVPLADGDKLDAAAAALQAETLERAQDAFVARTSRSAGTHRRIKRFRHVPYVAMTVDAAELDAVLGDAAVQYVGEVGRRRASAVSAPWNIDKIGVEKLWEEGHDGTGFAIAILDAGMQANHPSLRGRVVDEMCYSTMDPASDLKTLCPNGQEKMTGRGASKNCPVSYGDTCRHGTHVAGIAAAASWSGVEGVAPGADLILGQIFTEQTTPGDTGVYALDDDIISALERVYSLRNVYKIAAVNLSLGGGEFDRVCDTTAAVYVEIFRLLREAKIAPVVAAGNEGFDGAIGSPACASGAIAIGATTRQDEVTAFSNHSQLVKLMAPGEGILSSTPNNGKKLMDGTSQATPHVAGAFATLRGVKPGSSVAEILRALECTGVAVEAAGIRKRRIDLPKAMAVLLSPENEPMVFTFTNRAQEKKWTPLRGSSWRVSRGSYVPTFTALGDTAMSITPNCNSDLDVDVELSSVSGSVTASVILKAQADKSGEYFSGYVFDVKNTWSELTKKYTISPAIYRYDQHNPKIAAGGAVYLFGACSEYSPTSTKNIEVQVRGARMTLIVDGRTIGSVKDTNYTTGAVGLSARQITEGSSVKFDALTITPRDAKRRNASESSESDAISSSPVASPTLLDNQAPLPPC